MDETADELDWRLLFDVSEDEADELDCNEIFYSLHGDEPNYDRNNMHDRIDDFEAELDYRELNLDLRKIFEQASKEKCLEEVKAFLQPYDKLQRCKIVRRFGGKEPVIFKAIKSKYLDVIEYFIKECNADLEATTSCPDKGIIMGFGRDFNVTPLFYACMHGDLETVMLLVDSGAQLDWTNDKGQRAINAAIYKGHLEIVKYLMESMGQVDINNSAMYLAFLPNEQITKYLLSKGLDPNKKDPKGFTSLHRALQHDRHRYSNRKTIRMLLQANADPNIKDSEGLDAVMFAAKEFDEKSFNVLSSHADASRVSVVNGLELMGALAILSEDYYYEKDEDDDDDDHEIDEGEHTFWSKALSLRYADPAKPLLKEVEKPKEIFGFSKEFETFDELAALKGQPHLVLLNQAVIILERVIGQNHPFTLRHLTQSLAQSVLEDYDDYRKTFNILMYARNAYLDRNKFSGMSVQIMEAMIKVMYSAAYSGVAFRQEPIDLLNIIFKQVKDLNKGIREIQKEFFIFSDSDSDEEGLNLLAETDDNSSGGEVVSEIDSYSSGSELSNETDDNSSAENYQETCEQSENKLPSKRESENKLPENEEKKDSSWERESMQYAYQEHINSLSQCSNLLFFYLLAINNLKFNKEMEELFRQYVVEDIRGSVERESLLHIIAYITSYFEITHQNIAKYNVKHEVVAAFLDCLLAFKADVNCLDENDNTPLHYALRPIKEKKTRKQIKLNTTVAKLISHGAHLDYYNEDGECTLDILRDMDHDLDEIRMVSLQCLSARAIMQSRRRLNFREYLPPKLRRFCSLHSGDWSKYYI